MNRLLDLSDARRKRRPTSAARRLHRLLRTEISFVMHPSFAYGDEELEREFLERSEAGEVRAAALPRNLPAHLARMCEGRILTAEEEQSLFRRMNYWKYRANQIRAGLSAQQPDWSRVTLAEQYWEAAEQVRNRLLRANLRLVMSIVKRYVSAVHSFDDLLSDGIYSLMQAVDKFDYARGFRFSTYAYRAIARNAYRMISKQQQELVRFSSDAMEASASMLTDGGTPTAETLVYNRQREAISQLVRQLDRREQFIIRCRYALGAHRNVKTFQAIADKLGISKERVRQIEQRALNKLRCLAGQLDPDEFSAVFSM